MAQPWCGEAPPGYTEPVAPVPFDVLGKTASLTVRHCTQSAKMDSLLLLYIASRVLFTSVPLLDLAIRRYYAPRASYSNADLEFDAQHTALSSRLPLLNPALPSSFPILRGRTMMFFLFTNDRVHPL